MAQAQYAARGKMIRSMVTFAVIYCVCVWSIVCFSCVEADPLPHQHQMNTNGNSGNAEALSIEGVFESMKSIEIKIKSIAAIFTAIGTIIGVIIVMNTKGLNIFPCVKKWRFIKKLKQVIPDNPLNWNPLPDCKSPVELAMIRVNRKEEQQPNEERVKNQALGNVKKIMDSPGAMEVKACRIFDKGIFKDDGSIILLEGGPGMGKTTLGYSYCKKWKDGRLRKFDMAAFVPLHALEAQRYSTKDVTFDDLLLLACGNDDVMKEELKHYVVAGSSLLLVLDGWDEAPDTVMKSPDIFLCMLQRSISSQSRSKILITSRPDSSVNLDVNRVEIMGFTKDSINKFFLEVLCSSLNDEREVKDGCQELEKHLKAYPSIQSCCAIPLNAAIVARLFLVSDKKPRTLPHTRHELFSSMVAHLINKEQEKQCASAHKISHISCLEDLPDNIKKPLCELAFDHLKEIVIPHEMVVRTQLVECESANPNDASFKSATPILSPCLRVVLQTVKKRDPKSGGIMYYHHFIHLLIQELLAAYHISQLEEEEQVKVFQDLLDEPRFSAVLQFYAAFTSLTNQRVRNIILRRDYTCQLSSKLALLTLLQCFCEAPIQNPLLMYQKLVSRLNGNVDFANIALNSFDCISIGYFLAFALRAGRLCVKLPFCSIDDYLLGILLGELSRHANACPAGVLQGVTVLSLGGNKIGDKGITDIANSLRTYTTISDLNVFGCGISDIGVQSLAEAIVANGSITLERLNISDNMIGDIGIASIATALQMNTCTIKVFSMCDCGISDKGAESLARALAINRSMKYLDLLGANISDTGVAHISTALRVNNSLQLLNIGGDTTTDAAVLSLVDALKTNTSLKGMFLQWSSTCPGYTLKLMAEIFKWSILKTISLNMYMVHNAPTVSLEEEWLEHVEAGGKELILSMEDNRHLKTLHMEFFLNSSSLSAVRLKTCTSLEAAVVSVNSARSEKSYCALNFSCSIFDI